MKEVTAQRARPKSAGHRHEYRTAATTEERRTTYMGAVHANKEESAQRPRPKSAGCHRSHTKQIGTTTGSMRPRSAGPVRSNKICNADWVAAHLENRARSHTTRQSQQPAHLGSGQVPLQQQFSNKVSRELVVQGVASKLSKKTKTKTQPQQNKHSSIYSRASCKKSRDSPTLSEVQHQLAKLERAVQEERQELNSASTWP